MKKTILMLTVAMGFALTSTAQESVTESVDPNAPEFKFEKETFDYGDIPHKSDGVREFVFTNTGKTPLIISNATGSCGCTTPDWPKDPIAPGAKGVIKVKYDTNRLGAFTKTVTITSNAKTARKVLTIKGKVLGDEMPAEVTPDKTPETLTK